MKSMVGWILLTGIALVGMSVVVVAEEMQEPKPGPEHEKLAWFVGEWTGKGVFPASDFIPEGMESMGHYTFERTLGGMYVEGKYTSISDAGTFEGKVLYGYNPMKKMYSMHWFDDHGGSDTGMGTWEGNTLTFEYESDWMGTTYHNRTVVTITGDDSWDFRMDCGPKGTEAKEFMHASYTRETANGGTPECCRRAAEAAKTGGPIPECCQKAAAAKSDDEVPECCRQKK